MTKYIYKGIEVEVNEDNDKRERTRSSQQFMNKPPTVTKSSNEINHDDHHHHHHHHTDGSDKIDGKQIHLVKTQSGKYLSHYYPYMIYDTKLEVAKTLIDYVPEFGGKELKNKENVETQ